MDKLRHHVITSAEVKTDLLKVIGAGSLLNLKGNTLELRIEKDFLNLNLKTENSHSLSFWSRKLDEPIPNNMLSVLWECTKTKGISYEF